MLRFGDRWGPDSHVVFYPIRGGEIWNLVLICVDDLPPEVPRAEADIKDMYAKFEGWDPILTTLISNVQKCDKWKIKTMEELPTWTNEAVTLLGDACHPTLPYQAQGAAMAVEDGAIIGKLLGLQTNHSAEMSIPSTLELYETLRKKRTTLNVQGAHENRTLYHMVPKEVERLGRDEKLASLDWNDQNSRFPWSWGRLPYLKEILGFDAFADAEMAFHRESNSRS